MAISEALRARNEERNHAQDGRVRRSALLRAVLSEMAYEGTRLTHAEIAEAHREMKRSFLERDAMRRAA